MKNLVNEREHDMDDEFCLRVRMAAMAMADGEQPDMPRAEIDAHLAACPSCRSEIAAQVAVATRFGGVLRMSPDEDLWPGAMSVLDAGVGGRRSRTDPRPALLAAVALALYKIAELAPEQEPLPIIRLAPLLIAAALFLYLRNNPFRIEPGLLLEGE